jgi:hypothetical protein
MNYEVYEIPAIPCRQPRSTGSGLAKIRKASSSRCVFCKVGFVVDERRRNAARDDRHLGIHGLER